MPRFRLWWVHVCLTGFFVLTPGAAAADCGELDCGPDGICSTTSLLARCDCDDGYFSLRVRIEESSLGAYCVPEPAPLTTTGCDVARCEPHGTCAAIPDADAGGAECLCDPGYRLEAGSCVDDPEDDGEAVCVGVRCGTGNVCLPTPQGPTCRCLKGGSIALGSADDGKFGPVCTNPPNPKTACGPDACGPYGMCVISQAARCDCEEGATLRTLVASDGKERPYCVDPARPWPAELPPLDGSIGGAGGSSPGAGSGGSDSGGSGALDLDAGSVAGASGATGPTEGSNCDCRVVDRRLESRIPGRAAPWVAWLALGCASLARRSRRGRRRQGE